MEGRRFVVQAVRLVTPIADGLSGGGGEEWVSRKSTDGSDSAVCGDLDFEGDVTRAVGAESIGRILRLDAAEEAALCLRGRQPNGTRRNDVVTR